VEDTCKVLIRAARSHLSHWLQRVGRPRYFRVARHTGLGRPYFCFGRRLGLPSAYFPMYY
jgi:hypothetical protein